jgi:outer membrane protein TolC
MVSVTVLLLQLTLVPLSLAQEASAEPMRLDEVIAEARTRNPELKAAKERWAAAKLRVPQASALPNPSVGYTIMGPNFIETRTGPQDQVYEVEQMVPFPGKLWERRQMAVADTTATQAQLKAVERDVILKVSEAYYELYATDATVQVVEELHEALKRFEGIAQARYAAQGGSQRDVAKAQAEVSETLQRLLVLRQQRQTVAALVHALLDRDPHAPVGHPVKPALPTLSLTLEQLLELARQQRPELSEAEAQLTRDRHAKTLATFEYLPDLSVGFQYVQIGSGMTTDPDDGRDVWMVPLKITVPLWQNRLLPAVLEAQRNLRASEASFAQAENLAEYDVQHAYYRFTAAQQVVDVSEHALIPEAELAFRSDQAGYEAGRVDVLNLIDSERVYLNAQVAYHQALADALKSFAALERAVGTDVDRQGGVP